MFGFNSVQTADVSAMFFLGGVLMVLMCTAHITQPQSPLLHLEVKINVSCLSLVSSYALSLLSNKIEVEKPTEKMYLFKTHTEEHMEEHMESHIIIISTN